MANIVNTGSLQRFLDGPVQERLRQLAEEIKAAAEAQAPVATGDLKASGLITRTAGATLSSRMSGEAVKLSFTSPHAFFVHQGTGPGHIPDPHARYMPALHSLTRGRGGLHQWATDKGLPPAAVQRGIFNKGTPANPFLLRAIHQVLDRYGLRIDTIEH